ncbi:Baculoviral IAP repeat-containing protein 2 [Glycine soja]|uniref:Baculoviral IAP repeat-containing protein 2 n=1 Tax=Glycine soja TaxID=3848 RepID=A0A0B2QLH1_GLYSO|nr:Baculoviral IAP repeat-containing protein 2 [Glycine soja]
MAVQAQYPSNVLLLNSRNGQEEHEYSSLQPQPGGVVLLNQPHMLYNINDNGSNNNNNNTNSRKRGREDPGVGNNTITAASNVIDQFSLQSQPPQLVHLSQLHNHHQQQNNVVSTGLRLSFDDQHFQQQQRLQLHQNESQQHRSHSSAFLSLLSQGLGSQIKQQRDEIDQLLHAQGEQLRRALAEKRQRHYRALLSAAEEAGARQLREKGAEAVGVSSAVEGQAEDAESAYIDPERVVVATTARPKCRGCAKRVASVVVLPCRHLCVCTECDAHFRACPVCLTPKNSTVEVFLS